MSAGESLLNCTTGSGGVSSTNNCYNTSIDASQIVFGLAINCAIGLLCYAGFVLWRGEFRIYFNRLVSPVVPSAQRPPLMKLGGHWQLWSWLIPVFTLSDGALLDSAGLDALVAQRLLGFGCLALLPLSILGVAVLIPITYTSYEPAVTTTEDDDTTSINNVFLRMTMSAVPSGSHVLLVHFFFTYIFIGWVCWLLVQYYKEFISLRQAHDQRLLRNTMLDRRNSLLEDRAPSGGSSQIGKIFRLSTRVRSGGDVESAGSGARPAGISERPISVRFSGEAPAGPASNGELVPHGSGSPRSLGAGGDLARSSSKASNAVQKPQEGLQQSQDPRPQEQQVEASSQKLPHAGSGVGLRQRFSPSASVMGPSPFALQSGSDSAKGATELPPGHSSSSFDHAGEDRISANAPGNPALGVKRQGSGSSGCSGQAGKKWVELAEPLPLVGSADAAQFYTVLVVDAAVEEFSYSHTDSPWVWHMPTKLAGTPRLSLDALEGFVTSGKALARLTSVRDRQRLEHRHRRMQVAEEAYMSLFGDDFDRIIPVYHTKEADQVLAQWWQQRHRLDRLKLQQRRLAERRSKLEQEGEQEREVRLQVEDLAREVEGLKQLQLQKAAQQRQDQEEGGHQQKTVIDVRPKQQEQAAGQQPHDLQQVLEQQTRQAAEPQQDSQPVDLEKQQGAAQPDKQPWMLAGCCNGARPRDSGSADGGSPAAAAALSKRVVAVGPADEAIAKVARVSAKRERQLEKLAAQEKKLAQQVADTEDKLSELQFDFEDAQQVAAEALPAPCFFATFRTVQAAAQAARLNLNPLHERMMRALPAPAPNNVNYAALLRSWLSRGTRPLFVSFFVLLMLLFPIGVFAGVCGTIVSTACGTSTETINSSWFCSDDRFASILRNLISSTLPAILLSVWQAMVLPLWFYTCAQAEARHFSLSALDLRCAHWFFLHDLFNVFLGGMLGGSIMWGIRAVIDEPSQFFNILGQAAPASSNFFINYVSYRALAMAAFRLFFPHAAVFGGILKWLRLVPKPQTERDKEAAALPINCRFSRDLGVLQLTVFVVTFAYAIVSPLILPFGLVYFLLTWPVWRYQMLYVFQSNYDSNGQFWIYASHRIIICLGVMSSFTSAVLATKGAYVQGLVLFFTSIAFLYWFDTYLTMRYDQVVDQMPAVGLLVAPRARVDDRLYVPPPMRPKAAGWHPEWGKAWLGYGAPRYGL